MDKGTHIFGQGSIKPDAVFKFVATTLEIADIRVEFKNFTKCSKRLADVENALIGIAQEIGITVPQWKEASNKVIAARALQKTVTKRRRPSIVKDQRETELEERETNETTSPNAEETPSN